ncbi:DUF3641 domain-containing protein [Hymenobacter sp. HSC-4F20]|nr:DUF3641 domain-containing protein [Hymenobacter sp. HSC-4F20]
MPQHHFVSRGGYLYGCDFTHIPNLRVASIVRHISAFDAVVLSERVVVIDQDCYSSTAGNGFSCDGKTA